MNAPPPLFVAILFIALGMGIMLQRKKLIQREIEWQHRAITFLERHPFIISLFGVAILVFSLLMSLKYLSGNGHVVELLGAFLLFALGLAYVFHRKKVIAFLGCFNQIYHRFLEKHAWAILLLGLVLCLGGFYMLAENIRRQ